MSNLYLSLCDADNGYVSLAVLSNDSEVRKPSVVVEVRDL